MSSTGAEGEVPGTMWGGGRSKTLGAGGEVAPDEGQGVDLVDRHDQEERGGEGREDEVENRSRRREDLNLFQHLAQTASVVGGNPEDAPPVGADVEKVSGNSCQVSHPWLDHQPGQKLTVSGFEEDGGGRGGSHCSVHEAVVLYEVQRGLGEGGGGIVTATRPWVWHGWPSKWQPVRVHRCLLFEIPLKTGRHIVHREPAYCAPWYGIGGGGEDCVENPLASLAVPAARGLDVVKVERVVAGEGTIETSL